MTAMRPMMTCFLRRPNSSSSDSEEYEEIDEETSSRTEAEIIEIRARNKRCRRSKRAAALLGFIIGGHFLLVVPTSAVYLCYTFWPELKIHQTSFFYFYPWSNCFNSAFNPFIYFFLTKELRYSVGQWFRRKFRWCHNQWTHLLRLFIWVSKVNISVNILTNVVEKEIVYYEQVKLQVMLRDLCHVCQFNSWGDYYFDSSRVGRFSYRRLYWKTSVVLVTKHLEAHIKQFQTKLKSRS